MRMCVFVFVRACASASMRMVALDNQKMVPDPLELERQVVVSAPTWWVLGSRLQSSVRVSKHHWSSLPSAQNDLIRERRKCKPVDEFLTALLLGLHLKCSVSQTTTESWKKPPGYLTLAKGF